MTTGWFHGRVVGLHEDYIRDSRRRKQPESIVTGGDGSTLEAFVEQQDLARANDALRRTPISDWIRSRSGQLDRAFAVSASASAVLFVVGSVRSVLGETDRYGYGLLLFAVIAMAVSGIGSIFFSSLEGSKRWIIAVTIMGLGVLLAATVPPRFEVERCTPVEARESGVYAPRTVAACASSAAP